MSRKCQHKVYVGMKLRPALFANFRYMIRTAPDLLIAIVCKQAQLHIHACSSATMCAKPAPRCLTLSDNEANQTSLKD